MNKPFFAGTQYNDWVGTSAADDGDHGSLQKYVSEQGDLEDDEFIVGAEISIFGERAARGRPNAFILEIYIANGTAFEAVKARTASQRPLQVRCVEYEMDAEELFSLFKQFNVVFSRKGLLLPDNEISY